MENILSRSRRSGKYWWWKRGPSAACWTLRWLSTMEMMSLATVVMMVAPPGEPRTRARLGLPGLYQWVLVTSVVVLETALPSASTMEKCVVSVDCLTVVCCGGGGMKPAGRTRSLEGVGLVGSMEARQAAAYLRFAICLRGRLLKSGSPR